MPASLSRRIARRALFSATFAAGLYLAVPTVSHAFDRASPAPVNLSQGDIAIKGHDPVAYFTQSAAVPGSPEFTASHDGATYRFASAENRDTFLADPARYAPAYGGFCAFGASYGAKIDIDPTAFAVVNGRLYLNVSRRVNRRWSRDRANLITQADANWPRIKNTAPSAL